MFFVAALLLGTTSFQILTGGREADAADQVSFAIIGDYGSGLVFEQQVADMVASWSPAFIGTTGDNIYSADNIDGFAALDRKVGRYYHDFMYPYAGSFGAGSPTQTNRFFPALGNHDWGDPGTPMLTCNAVSCSGPWADFFSLPGNERYYDVRDGPVHLFVVDDYYLEPDGHQSSSVQAAWLKNSLASSDAPWKIVLTHFAPQVSRDGGGQDSIRWPFAEWGASMVVSGHYHFYERLSVDGVVYAVNGLGGAGISSFGPTHPNSIVRYNGGHGAMRITATDNELVSEFVALNGTVVDRLVLTKGQPPPPPTTLPTSTTVSPATTTTPAPVTRPYAGASGRLGTIVRLYEATLLRQPDESGLEYWNTSGIEIGDIAHGFIAGHEFQATYGAVTQTEFITLLYRNVLGREPDPSGLNYWSAQFDDGATHVQVLLGFSESAEFKIRTQTS